MSATTNGHDVDLREQLVQYADTVELLQERLAELELAQEDIGWTQLEYGSAHEFSRHGLDSITKLARLMYLKNPLIKNAVSVQAHYVFSQGVSVSAAAAPVNDVVQAFWDDPHNRAEFTSHESRMGKEVQLQIEANLFFALFTDTRATGRVRVRTIPFHEIRDIISNPDDARDPWFYQRTWTNAGTDDVGALKTRETTAYYPDWRYNPASKPTTINGKQVRWEAPVFHVRTGGLPDMRFGVSEVYAALDWARAVKEDLEDWATIRRAHARFAWNLGVKGGKSGVAAAKAKLGTTVGTGTFNVDTNPAPTVGSTFIGSDGVSMNPIRTAGAAPSPEDGHRLWLMVAAGAGLPETILAGNAKSGNLATAKSLDRPTELKMEARRSLWTDVFKALIEYAIEQSVRAPKGLLKGSVVIDAYTGDEIVVLAPDPNADPNAPDYDPSAPMSKQVDVDFPNLLDRDIKTRVDAVVAAASTTTLSPELTARLLLMALEVDDVDEEMDKLFPQDDEPQNVDDQADAGIAAESQFMAAIRELRATVAGGSRGV